MGDEDDSDGIPALVGNNCASYCLDNSGIAYQHLCSPPYVDILLLSLTFFLLLMGAVLGV